MIDVELWAFMGPKIKRFEGDPKFKITKDLGETRYSLVFRSGSSISFKLEDNANKFLYKIEKGQTQFSIDDLAEEEFNDLEAFNILKDYSKITLPNHIALNVKAYLGENKKIEDLCSLQLFKEFSVEEIRDLLKYRRLDKFNENWYKGLICPSSVRSKLISRRQFLKFLKLKYEDNNSSLSTI